MIDLVDPAWTNANLIRGLPTAQSLRMHPS